MTLCVTCGAAPTSTFTDGSPRYSCGPHAPVRGEDGMGDYRLVVELTDAEMALGAACGKRRFEQSRRRKLRDKLSRPDLPANIVGAQGELAFAKWLGVPFVCTTGAYNGAADVAGCQVKTRTKTGYELVVHEADPPRIPVVLVTAHPPRFWIRGWIFAIEARKHPEFRKDPGGLGRSAWFVPSHFLRSIHSLRSNDLVPVAVKEKKSDAVREASTQAQA